MKPTKQTRLTEEPKTEKSTADRPQEEFIAMKSVPSKPEGPPPLPPESQEKREFPVDSGKRGRSRG